MKRSEIEIVFKTIDTFLAEASKSARRDADIAKRIFSKAKDDMEKGPIDADLLDKLNFHARNAPSPALRNKGSGLLLKHKELHGFHDNSKRKSESSSE
jgi:hypothetical protein